MFKFKKMEYSEKEVALLAYANYVYEFHIKDFKKYISLRFINTTDSDLNMYYDIYPDKIKFYDKQDNVLRILKGEQLAILSTHLTNTFNEPIILYQMDNYNEVIEKIRQL